MDCLCFDFYTNHHDRVFNMKSFTSHYVFQRVTACILLALVPWFLGKLFYIKNLGHQEIIENFGNMSSALWLLILLISGFYHGYLGIQTICIDYLPNKRVRSSIIFIAGTTLGISSIFGIFSLMRLVMFK